MYLRSPLVRIIFGLFLSLVLFSACSTSGDRIEADPLFVQAHSFGEIATTSPVILPAIASKPIRSLFRLTASEKLPPPRR
jgi:hypothetical protein